MSVANSNPLGVVSSILEAMVVSGPEGDEGLDGAEGFDASIELSLLKAPPRPPPEAPPPPPPEAPPPP